MRAMPWGEGPESRSRFALGRKGVEGGESVSTTASEMWISFSAPGGSRSHDKPLKRRLLYHLSYRRGGRSPHCVMVAARAGLSSGCWQWQHRMVTFNLQDSHW